MWLKGVCGVLCLVGVVGCVDELGQAEQSVSGDLTITPTTVDFGSIVVGKTATTTFTVTNHGTVKTDTLVRTLTGDQFTLTAGCTGKLAPNASCTFGVKLAPTSVGMKAGSVDISGVVATFTGSGVPDAQLVLTPSTVDFGSNLIGATSATQTVVVANSGGVPTGVPTVTVGAQYSIVGNTCVAALAPGATCSLAIAFVPTTAGVKHANLTVKATPGGTVVAALVGNAVASGAIALSPGSWDFGAISVGQESATRTFTVHNTGSVATDVPAFALTGGGSPAFALVDDTCNGGLAAGASCAIGVRFAPTVAGAQMATLIVNANHGGSAIATLTGSGVADAQLQINPSAVDFGTVIIGTASNAFSFTIANAGGSTSGVPAVALSGPNANMFAILGNTCTSPLFAGQTCTVVARFAPTFPGAASATLTVVATPGGSASAALFGVGVSPGQLTVAPSARDYGTIAAGTTSAAQTFTVSNSGGTPTGTLATTLSGDSFAIVSDSCSGIVLASSASCTIAVQFGPASAGQKAGSLGVQGFPGGSVFAQLTGIGIAPPALVISPAIFNYGSLPVGQTSNATFTVTNNGGAPTGVATVSMTNVVAFTFVADTCTGTALAPNASCNVVVQFIPVTLGAQSGTMVVTASPGGSVAASLVGLGINPISISPVNFDYGTVAVGTASDHSFTVTNSGPHAATVSPTLSNPIDFTIAGSSCPGALAGGASCTIVARFAPTSIGAKSTTLTIAGGSALLVGTAIGGASLSISPSTISYGVVSIGSSSGFTLVVANTGSAATGVPTVAISGVNASMFFISANNCAASLAPGQTCSVDLNFAPTVAGAASASVTLTASPGGSVTASLTGVGTAM